MAKDSKEYTTFILTELRKGNIKFTDVALLFYTKFNLSKPTFAKYWKKANELHNNFIQKRETKLNEATIQGEVLTLSNGLKSKSERLINLQNQVNEINGMLESGISPDTIIDTKTLTAVDIERKITYIERSQLMKALRDLQSEISKIEGDYAPTKQQNENSGFIKVIRE
jgi:hypothetical protein